MSRLTTAQVQLFADEIGVLGDLAREVLRYRVFGKASPDTDNLPKCEICGGIRFRVRVCPVHVGEHYEITARCRFCGHGNAITREEARALRTAAEKP